RCTHCEALLRVPDDAAGKQARCPKCASILPVPEASIPFAGVVESHDSATGTLTAAPAQGNPYASPGGLAGSPALAGPHPVSPIVPTPIELGEVISRSWKLFIDHFGTNLLAMLCMIGVMLGVMLLWFIITVIPAVMILVGNQGKPD